MSEYVCMIIIVVIPGLPLPIFLRSILTIGVISAAVPDKKTSSAEMSSSFVIFWILVFNLISFENAIIAFRVIPAYADEFSGGVIKTSFFTRNMFSPGASLTLPSLSKSTASSKPLLFASWVAKIEFR